MWRSLQLRCLTLNSGDRSCGGRWTPLLIGNDFSFWFWFWFVCGVRLRCLCWLGFPFFSLNLDCSVLFFLSATYGAVGLASCPWCPAEARNQAN